MRPLKIRYKLESLLGKLLIIKISISEIELNLCANPIPKDRLNNLSPVCEIGKTHKCLLK